MRLLRPMRTSAPPRRALPEASSRLRQCKRELHACREELSRLIKELKTGESRYPLLERFGANGQSINPTPDEHQRGPTEFPASTVSLAPQQGRPAVVTTPAPVSTRKAPSPKRKAAAK